MEMEAGTVMAVIIMWLLILTTITGNMMTLIIILKTKNLRNSPHVRFLLSLASADLAVGIFVMGPSVIRIMVKSRFVAFVKMFAINNHGIERGLADWGDYM